MKNYDEVYNYVKNKLGQARFHHSECVMERCEILAKVYGVDIEKAKLVGIFHDVAKEMPNEEKIMYCQKNNIDIDELEFENPGLLHGKIGADIAKNEFGFSDDMCLAIQFHTTGRENLTILEKIIIVADKSGNDRGFEDLKYLQERSLENIDEVILYIFEYEINKTIKKRQKLHINTVYAYNDLIRNENK